MAQTATPTIDPASKSMDDLVALCKRRGFIYPASEIYGGINGFWDYGPLGSLLKNNLRDRWWRDMVLMPPVGPDGHRVQIVGVDSSIIQNPKAWIASGHVGGFNDPMADCKDCKSRFRADHVQDILDGTDWYRELIDMWEGDAPASAEPLKGWARKRAKKKAPNLALVQDTDRILRDLDDFLSDHAGDPDRHAKARGILLDAVRAPNGVCPNCGGGLTEPRMFNLMFETYVGAIRDEDAKAYLRPETAQGIFLNYKNVVDTTRVRVPFGIAQIGKAFRNEVTPRNFIFRSREFEQMEMEWFCHPSEAPKWFEFWQQTRLDWWRSLGIDESNLVMRAHESDELSHYAKEGCGTGDVEYRYPFTAPGFGELEGIAHRTDFDLKAHQQHSGAKVEYFDQERNERYVPHVIEPASGLSRGVLVLLCEAFTPDPERASKVFMKFPPEIAPIKAAVYPLVNKDGMPEVAEGLHETLLKRFGRLGMIEHDAKQSIGKRYARMDEAGCPFCFTVDGATLTDQAVTVRHRDTQLQERIAIDAVPGWLAERLGV